MRNSALFVLAPLAIVAPYAQSATFTVSDIQINGLTRISPDSLYPIIPINSGDVVTDNSLTDSIQSLYNTGNFADIKAYQSGNQLIFDVVERPMIANISFDGNRMIPKDALLDGLKRIGISEGNVLKQSTLEQLQHELKQQYNQQGYYNSDIKVTQTELDNNRVALHFDFMEGKPARIVDITILGNQYFDDEDIEQALKIKETSWVNIISKSDRYAKEKLAGGIENLTAMYQNAGFVKFSVDNAVLNISPDKKNVYIELSVNEGEQYKFGETKFLGNPSFDLATLQKQISFKTGEQYSQKQITTTTHNLITLYGNDGYYFAQIRPVPRINDDTKTVDMDIFIDPVRPVYVRRINFTGNTKTADEVLRREMRQMEGALASNDKIELSRVRLMRTGFFKSVNVDVRPITNAPDQVDINIAVEEQPSGSSTIAAGYSQSAGLTFQAGLSQSNFLGTGNRVNISMSRSETLDSYSIGYLNPFFTPDGISQGGSLYYRKTKYDDRNISNYVTDSYGGRLTMGYPVDETKSLSAGVTLDRTTLQGGRNLAVSNYTYLKEQGKLEIGGDEEIPSFKAGFNTASLDLGWGMSNLDRGVFPTKGMSHNINLSLTFGDIDYQKLIYEGNYYHPFIKNTVIRAHTKLGYGNDLPFWQNFFAGGYGSVRGYDNGTLGPLSGRYSVVKNFEADPYPEEVGGNALAQVGLELILPMPFKGDWAEQIRPALFIEGAQVFDTTDKYNRTETVGSYTTPLLYPKDDDMRFSAGIGMTWITPIGPIAISYAKPINAKDTDRTDNVQFEIGRVF